MSESKTEAELIVEDLQEMRDILGEASHKLALVKLKIDAMTNNISDLELPG